MYNALAGICEEDVANAGGGGTPPAGVTLNQLYFSDSATNGANAGCIISFFRNGTFNSGPPNFTITSGVGTNITGLSAPTVSVVNSTTTKSAYTLSATTLINFLVAAQQNTNPFQVVYIGIGAFLQFPNNSNTISGISFISCVHASTTSSGLFVFNPAVQFGNSLEAPNFPQQNLLAIGNDTPVQGLSSNWGLLGVGQLTFNVGSSSAIDYCQVYDNRGRGGTISAGDVITIVYQAKASGGNLTEIGFHIVEITLT